jgi:hypothetical protein
MLKQFKYTAPTACGLTHGKVYTGRIADHNDLDVVLFDDDDGDPRKRSIEEFEEVPHTRRAWARFPSLQAVFG